MRNKYQKLTWVWIFCTLFMAIFTFFIGIDKAFPNQTIRFFNGTSYLLLSLLEFVGGSSLLSSTVDELAAKARKQLPWNEYFNLKKRNYIRWILPQQINQFKFAKKIDRLVFENKLWIWR